MTRKPKLVGDTGRIENQNRKRGWKMLWRVYYTITGNSYEDIEADSEGEAREEFEDMLLEGGIDTGDAEVTITNVVEEETE